MGQRLAVKAYELGVFEAGKKRGMGGLDHL